MRSTEARMNIDDLKELFQKSADVQFHMYTFRQHKVHFITCDAMIDEQMLNDVILQRVQLFFDNREEGPLEEALMEQLHIPSFSKIAQGEEVVSLLYTGHLLLYFEEDQLLFSSNIVQKPNRSPEETTMEVLVKGPRDNFIEDLSVNIALIRKRLPTNSLCVEKMELGKRSKTTVAILYFDDIADKAILNGIKGELEKIDMDVILSGDLLMEQVNKSSKLFPRTDYTGRPDYAVQSLVRGRFLIFVDGVSYVVIMPVNLFLLMKSGEDNDSTVFFSSFERVLRLVGIGIGLLLPAFWLALMTFHQDQMPMQLLATIVQSNTGVPLPAALEMLLMLFMFELFREAGLRLPSAIGGTISVVGGLIIGDAAIKAGVTSPAMIVIIAISTIATFTLVNQSLVTAVGLLRITFILLTAFLGLFGFFMSIFFLLLYLASIRTFGVPYLNIATDLNWKNIKETLFRLSPQSYNKRPDMLNPKDKTRNKEDEQ